MTPDLTALLEQLAADFNRFHQEACLRIDNGNAAAGARSRVISMEIEKQLKVWRKASLAKGDK